MLGVTALASIKDAGTWPSGRPSAVEERPVRIPAPSPGATAQAAPRVRTTFPGKRRKGHPPARTTLSTPWELPCQWEIREGCWGMPGNSKGLAGSRNGPHTPRGARPRAPPHVRRRSAALARHTLSTLAGSVRWGDSHQGLGARGAVRTRGDAVPTRPPPPTPTSSFRPRDSAALGQGNNHTAPGLLASQLTLVFLGLRRSDRGALTSRGGLIQPPSTVHSQWTPQT